MNEGTLSTAFSPNSATKLCFFVLGENLPHGPRPVQTFLPVFWPSVKNYRFNEARRLPKQGAQYRMIDLTNQAVLSFRWL